jgi:hypothetical protein
MIDEQMRIALQRVIDVENDACDDARDHVTIEQCIFDVIYDVRVNDNRRDMCIRIIVRQNDIECVALFEFDEMTSCATRDDARNVCDILND